MSQRYTLDISNPLDDYIKKQNEKIEKHHPIIPRVCDHSLFLGSTMSGKSHLMKQLLYHEYDKIFDRIVIICPTYDKENYSELFEIPETDIFRDYDEDIVMNILEESKEKFLAKNGDYFTLIVFDDCVDDMKHYRRFNKFISTARHYGITVWCSTQYCYNVAKPVRQQFVCQFIWTNVTDENLKEIKNILPVSLKKANQGIEEVRLLNKEIGNSYTPLYLSKRFPGRMFYGIDNELEDDEF